MQSRHKTYGVDAPSSVLSSDIESVSVIDSEDTCSRSAGHNDCVTVTVHHIAALVNFGGALTGLDFFKTVLWSYI